MDRSKAAKLGYWAALASVIETAIFLCTLIAGLLGVNALMLAFLVCACLPATFIAMIAMLPSLVPQEKRWYTSLALAFASVYAAFSTTVYFLQLSVVRNNPLGLAPDVIRLLAFTPGSAAFAIDMLGYGFMCLAAAALIPAVMGTGKADRWLRGLLAVKGLMVFPTVIFPTLVGPVAPDGAKPPVDFGAIALIGWCLVFLPIAAMFAKRFRRAIK